MHLVKSRFVNFVRTETSSDQTQARRMFTCEDVVNSFNQNANDGFSLWCNAVLKFPANISLPLAPL